MHRQKVNEDLGEWSNAIDFIRVTLYDAHDNNNILSSQNTGRYTNNRV